MVVYLQLRVIAVIAQFALTATPVCQAASFQVNPIRAYLTPQASSILIAVRNEDSEKLRVQVETVLWSENKQGQMQLTPTKEIAFYPTLLSIDPGEERNIRIAAKTPVGSMEKTYRIFIAELPGATKTSRSSIRMLTRFSIPIFLQPEKSLAQVQVEKFDVQRGEFLLELSNRGNIHALPRDIKLQGMNAEGSTTFEKQVAPWYVLAGGAREFRGEIPKNECAKTKSLSLHVELEGKMLVEKLPLPVNACAL